MSKEGPWERGRREGKPLSLSFIPQTDFICRGSHGLARGRIGAPLPASAARELEGELEGAFPLEDSALATRMSASRDAAVGAAPAAGARATEAKGATRASRGGIGEEEEEKVSSSFSPSSSAPSPEFRGASPPSSSSSPPPPPTYQSQKSSKLKVSRPRLKKERGSSSEGSSGDGSSAALAGERLRSFFSKCEVFLMGFNVSFF